MTKIAFKRAKSSPNLDDVMHPEFITEYADTSLFPEGFHKVEDGHEFLSKEEFDKELAKNPDLIEEFKQMKLDKMEQIRVERLQVEAQQRVLSRKEERKQLQELIKSRRPKGGKNE